MKLSNLEMTEKSINVQENDKNVQENDMLLAESQPSQLLRLHSLRSADTNNAPSNLCGGESYCLVVLSFAYSGSLVPTMFHHALHV